MLSVLEIHNDMYAVCSIRKISVYIYISMISVFFLGILLYGISRSTQRWHLTSGERPKSVDAFQRPNCGKRGDALKLGSWMVDKGWCKWWCRIVFFAYIFHCQKVECCTFCTGWSGDLKAVFPSRASLFLSGNVCWFVAGASADYTGWCGDLQRCFWWKRLGWGMEALGWPSGWLCTWHEVWDEFINVNTLSRLLVLVFRHDSSFVSAIWSCAPWRNSCNDVEHLPGKGTQH